MIVSTLPNVISVNLNRDAGCVFQDIMPPEFSPFPRKRKKVLGSIRRERFTKATQDHGNPKKQRSVAPEKSRMVESHESTWQRLESYLLTNEDCIAGKGFTSMTQHSLVHKFSNASSNADSRCQHGEQVKSEKEVILEAHRDKRKVHFYATSRKRG